VYKTYPPTHLCPQPTRSAVSSDPLHAPPHPHAPPQIRRRPLSPGSPPHPSPLSPDPSPPLSPRTAGPPPHPTPSPQTPGDLSPATSTPYRRRAPTPGAAAASSTTSPTAGSYSKRNGGLLLSLPDGGLHSLPVRPTAGSYTGRGGGLLHALPDDGLCTPSRCGRRRNPTPGAAATSALLWARRDARGHEATTSANRDGELRRPRRRRRGGRW
jgi:hypothetical protein